VISAFPDARSRCRAGNGSRTLDPRQEGPDKREALNWNCFFGDGIQTREVRAGILPRKLVGSGRRRRQGSLR
jgi:hypothetical protein